MAKCFTMLMFSAAGFAFQRHLLKVSGVSPKNVSLL
jgi:hypothetical protein